MSTGQRLDLLKNDSRMSQTWGRNIPQNHFQRSYNVLARGTFLSVGGYLFCMFLIRDMTSTFTSIVNGFNTVEESMSSSLT